MVSSEELLEKAARDGSLDIAEWPRVLESLLQRLHDIVHNEFPIPALPQPASQHEPPHIDPQVVASTPPHNNDNSIKPESEEAPRSTIDDKNALTDSQGSAKENEPPTDIAAGRAPPIAPNTSEQATTAEAPSGPPPTIQDNSVQAPAGTLPPDLLSLYQTSRRILEYDFPSSPPYTIQRLAELVLRPKSHYRYLPAYLRALDRIVSVSSPLSNFPLPTTIPSSQGFLTNGITPQTNGVQLERDSLGSDESLGGALLTPIPWLGNGFTPSSNTADGEIHSESTETIDGPHGAGSIETVSVTVNGVASTSSAYTSSSPIASPTLSEQSDASSSSESSMEAQLREQGGVTQGELLRQEQEAGVVPLGPNGVAMAPRRTLISGGAAAVGRDVGGVSSEVLSVGDEEQPHARGPGVIGMEDMGPQKQNVEGRAVLDMEAAVGRGRSKSPQPPVVVKEEDGGGDGMEGVESGKSGGDPKVKEGMDEERVEDGDGDVVLADVDGKEVGGEVESAGEAKTEEDVELKTE